MERKSDSRSRHRAAPERGQWDADLRVRDARMEKLLAAAKETFTTKGFDATTMDDVAGAAGMSKKTLYKLFESKTELFRAMLLGSIPEVQFSNPSSQGSPISHLRHSLRQIADVALAPDEIALHRLIIGECRASPGLGRMFAEVIMEGGLDNLVGLLKKVRLASHFQDLPLRFVAEMLLGTVFGHDHFRLLIDEGFRFNRRSLDKRIDLAISIFCAVEGDTARLDKKPKQEASARS